VRRFWHQLVGLDQGELGQATEVGLEAPDPLFGVEHRVVVAFGPFQFDRQAVRHHLVAGFPGVHRRSGAQHDAGQVRADHVVWQVMPVGERGEPAVTGQEGERRDRFEDRRPDGVVVDRAGHHRDDRFARAQLGSAHLVEV
jgi:hypothetical protein